MKQKRKPGRPAKEKPDDGFAPNLDVLGELLGVDRKTIQNARKRFAKDAPKKRLDGRYPILEYKAWLAKHDIRGRRKDPEMEDERAIRLDLLRIDRDQKRFNLEKAKSQSLPLAQYQFALQSTCTALLATLNAFVGRVNPLLEGLDFHDRQAKLEEEIEIVKRTIHGADYLPTPTPGIE